MNVVHTNLGYLGIKMDGLLDLITCIVHKNLMEICSCAVSDTSECLW
jgi:hypothetical protein